MSIEKSLESSIHFFVKSLESVSTSRSTFTYSYKYTALVSKIILGDRNYYFYLYNRSRRVKAEVT